MCLVSWPDTCQAEAFTVRTCRLLFVTLLAASPTTETASLRFCVLGLGNPCFGATLSMVVVQETGRFVPACQQQPLTTRTRELLCTQGFNGPAVLARSAFAAHKIELISQRFQDHWAVRKQKSSDGEEIPTDNKLHFGAERRRGKTTRVAKSHLFCQNPFSNHRNIRNNNILFK